MLVARRCPPLDLREQASFGIPGQVVWYILLCFSVEGNSYGGEAPASTLLVGSAPHLVDNKVQPKRPFPIKMHRD